MFIQRKTARRTGKSLFVFHFIDEKEFEYILSVMRKAIDDKLPDNETFGPERHIATELVNKIESRTDSKYSDDEYKLSGMLFDDEMADFAYEMFLLVVLYH